MTPHRIGGTGSFRFDRVFAGVGRINCSSGTTKVKEFQRRDQLLTELFEHAQLEALRSFQRGDTLFTPADFVLGFPTTAEHSA